jgi:CRISPR-associated protein Cmr4
MKYLTFVRTITNLHVGSGQSVGTVDLPIAREKATNWPLIPGTSVKGVLKEAAMDSWLTAQQKPASEFKEAERALASLFGSPDDSDAFAGALTVSDQRLLLMPVRSFHGTFAWVTSPLALRRFKELAAIGAPDASLQEVSVPATDVPTCLAAADSYVAKDKIVLLEDLDLKADDHGPAIEAYATLIAAGAGMDQKELLRRLLVVDDTVFSYLAETGTEVVTKVSLSFETRTARQGMLRSEESVPPDAVFAGVGLFQARKKDDSKTVEEYLEKNKSAVLQFGGKASTGSGLCQFNFAGGAK